MFDKKSGYYYTAPGRDALGYIAKSVVGYANQHTSPLALQDIVIFVPTNRSRYELGEKIGKLAGRPLVLPNIYSLSSIDVHDFGVLLPESKRVLTKIERQALMVEVLQEHIEPHQLLSKSQEILSFLDEVIIEGIKTYKKDSLLYEELSEESKTLLKIVFEEWPTALSKMNAIDAAQLSNESISEIANSFPFHNKLVVLAGSTGTIPATRKLMHRICNHDKGYVILPGFLPIEEKLLPHHPQYTMHTCLNNPKVQPLEVDASPRTSLLTTVQTSLTTVLPNEFSADIEFIETKSLQEEAEVIALIALQHIQEKGTSLALVTPDRTLATYVRHACVKWNVAVDDSAGASLAECAEGKLYLNVLKLLFHPENLLSWVDILKHPLVCKVAKNMGRDLDIKMRGYIPDPFEFLYAYAWNTKEAVDIWSFLLEVMNPSKNLKSYLDKVESVLMILQVDIGASTEGQELQKLLTDIGSNLASFDALAQHNPVKFFTHLFQSTTIRKVCQSNRRLYIWGPLEARLMSGEAMIIGSANEGVWPVTSQPDDWATSAVREYLNLPPLERRQGLSGHDLIQLFSSKKVYVTRAQTVDGNQGIPSRWWMRFKALYSVNNTSFLSSQKWEDVLHQHCCYANLRKLPVPIEVCPPVEPRPRSLSVTDVGLLIRDPYAVYAKHILKLKPMEPLLPKWGNKERGIIVHEILEKIVASSLDLDAALDVLRAKLKSMNLSSLDHLFWNAHIQKLLVNFFSLQKRRAIDRSYAEIKGIVRLPLKNGDFTLRGTADRIDIVEDTVYILDYKTGSPPSKKMVEIGVFPQLLIEAIILQDSGFNGVTSLDSLRLEYWGLNKEEVVVVDSELVNRYKPHLLNLLNIFLSKSVIMTSSFSGDIQLFNDYAHLERIEKQ